MRHKGNYSEIKRIRNKVLIGMFKAVKRTCQYNTISEICEALSSQSVDRYYFSEERGYEIYSTYKKKGTIPNGSRWRKKMYVGFIIKCEHLEKQGMNLRDAVWQALTMPAECIGLSPCRIQDILCEEGIR